MKYDYTIYARGHVKVHGKAIKSLSKKLKLSEAAVVRLAVEQLKLTRNV